MEEAEMTEEAVTIEEAEMTVAETIQGIDVIIVAKIEKIIREMIGIVANVGTQISHSELNVTAVEPQKGAKADQTQGNGPEMIEDLETEERNSKHDQEIGNAANVVR